MCSPGFLVHIIKGQELLLPYTNKVPKGGIGLGYFKQVQQGVHPSSALTSCWHFQQHPSSLSTEAQTEGLLLNHTLHASQQNSAPGGFLFL